MRHRIAAGIPLLVGHQRLQHALLRIQQDHVAGADPAQRPAGQHFRRHMDGGRHLARRARHAAVGHQRDMAAGVLQYAQRWRQRMQFRHAIGARSLEAHHGDEVTVELSFAEVMQERFLRVEHDGGRLDHPVLRLDRRDLDHRAAEIARHQAQTAVRRKWVGRRPHHALVAASRQRIAPDQLVVDQQRLGRVLAQALAEDGLHVLMQQAGVEQFADHETGAAGCMEIIHVGFAVRVDTRKQRHHARQLAEIVPVDDDAGRAGNRHQVHRVIGRAASGQQRDDGVDDGFFIDHVADRQVLARLVDNLHRTPGGGGGQRIAQRRAGRDEGGAWQVQAHDFHQHLVAVGGAVEGAGASRMVGARLRFQQFLAAQLALCVKLADAGFLGVGHAGGHRAARDEHRRQMRKVQRADQQARHDLVADAEVDGGVEHVMRQRHRGRHGDGVAREQRQLHAGLALGHAVAHGGRAAGELGHAADLAHRFLDPRGVMLERLMRGEHVVVRRNDGDRRLPLLFQHQLVIGRKGGETVGEVGAAQRAALHTLPPRQFQAGQVGAAIRLAALDDARRDRRDDRMKRHDYSLLKNTCNYTTIHGFGFARTASRMA